MASTPVIYKIVNLINGKIYVGKDTANNPKYYGSGIWIKRAIKKYGKENFRKEILEFCTTDLDVLEVHWIAKLNARDPSIGYNIAAGGTGSKPGKDNPMFGRKHSEHTKATMSFNRSGEKNAMFGKKHSEKIKKKLSILSSRENLSEETLEKMSVSHKGFKHSDKSKIKMSKVTRGSNNPFFGKKHTESSKDKIASNHADVSGKNNPMYGVRLTGKKNPFFGKKHSEETRRKISEALKKRYADNNAAKK